MCVLNSTHTALCACVHSDGGDPLTGTDTRAQRRQSAASNTVDAYLSRSGRADKRLSTHVKILGEPTPIAGTVYVTATVRLRGCTAQVFQKHLLLKVNEDGCQHDAQWRLLTLC